MTYHKTDDIFLS